MLHNTRFDRDVCVFVGKDKGERIEYRLSRGSVIYLFLVQCWRRLGLKERGILLSRKQGTLTEFIYASLFQSSLDQPWLI